MCVAVEVFFPLCAGVASPVGILGVHVCIHVPLYFPHLGTQNYRNLATTSPGKRNVPGAISCLMKLPLRAHLGTQNQ